MQDPVTQKFEAQFLADLRKYGVNLVAPKYMIFTRINRTSQRQKLYWPGRKYPVRDSVQGYGDWRIQMVRKKIKSYEEQS